MRKAGELHVISASVDPRLEISEITDRVVKAGGPALLFTDVQGSEFPVLTNQFGTQSADGDGARRRRASTRSRRAFARSSTSRRPSGSLFEKLAGALRLAPLANAIPKIVRDGSVHEVVIEQPDLTKLTGLDDVAARCRTVHHAAARDHQRSANGRSNVGMYRMQVYNATRDRDALATP